MLLPLGTFGTAWAEAGKAIAIAPHRAVYSMRLAVESPPGPIVDGRGVLVFEWAESCESWEIKQRMALELTDKSEQQLLIDHSITSSEAKDGLSFQFATMSRHNGRLDKNLRGNGSLRDAGGSGEVTFSRPRGARMDLPRGTMFPTDHVLLLLNAARKGQKHVTRTVYDGDNTDAPYEVSASIGQRLPASEAPVKRPLGDQDFWRMRLAYFPTGEDAELPETEITIALQDNGVARRLKLDYGDYVLDIDLERIEPLPRPEC